MTDQIDRAQALLVESEDIIAERTCKQTSSYRLRYFDSDGVLQEVKFDGTLGDRLQHMENLGIDDQPHVYEQLCPTKRVPLIGGNAPWLLKTPLGAYEGDLALAR